MPSYELAKYTYTGQYSYMDDPSTASVTEGFGLMFYNARWYDLALGRFPTPFHFGDSILLRCAAPLRYASGTFGGDYVAQADTLIPGAGNPGLNHPGAGSQDGWLYVKKSPKGGIQR